jgi:hypothetical protein
MIKGYFKFAVLPEDIKKLHKIKSASRLDCIAFTDNGLNQLSGLTNFVNGKKQLTFYRTDARQFVKANGKRIAQWALTGNGINFSSLFIEITCPQFAFGCPNSKELLKSGEKNPMAMHKNDGYLFIVNSDFSEIEILILPNCAQLIELLYQQLLDGNFDEQIEALRKQASPFFDYMPANSNLFSLTNNLNL